MGEHYRLDGKSPVPCSLMEWAEWMKNTKERCVAVTEIGPSRVSTVFLGLDHSFGGATPILFETMVFGGPLDQEEERYSTWEEAENGHAAMVERVKRGATMDDE